MIKNKIINQKKSVYMFFMAVFVVFSLVACSSSSNGESSNGNNDQNNSENGNQNQDNDQETPTAEDKIKGTKIDLYDNLVLMSETDERLVYYTSDEPAKVAEFYSNLEGIVGSGADMLYAYQTPVLSHVYKMPTNVQSEDYEDQVDKWQEEFHELSQEFGGLMAILIASADHVDVADVVGDDYVGSIPANANTVVSFNFIDLEEFE